VVGTVAEILVAMLDQALLTTLVAAMTTTTMILLLLYIRLLLLYIHLQILYIRPPDPVTVSPTDTSNVYDFYEPDPVTVSPTDTSNVYDFYEPDPVTVYDGGSNDEETVMLQPVTYTGPAVETTLDTDPVVDFSLDDLTNIRGTTPPQTNWVGNNTQEAYNADPNSRYDFDYSAAYDTEIIPEKIGALPKEEVVTDGTVVSSVPKPIGPTVTVSTSNASNIAEGRFEGIRDKLEALGYTVSANGSSVYTADGQVAGENWSGSSTISNMLKENQDQNGALASINNNPTAKQHLLIHKHLALCQTV
jgi:hypothetical protein